jgi:UPF0271 protein
MDIDLNCDLGEGAGGDAELLPLVTSASIACGFHAGGPAEAAAALAAASRHGVVVGAHPSYPDREHFGRRELARTPEQVRDDCFWQVGALAALADAAGTPLRHLKPHGALYHAAGRDPALALAIVDAAVAFQLAVFGLPGSALQTACIDRCRFVPEGFADRRYRPDGTLVPRDQPGAYVDGPEEAVAQVERLLEAGTVETICVHGDNPDALAFVRALRQALVARGHRLRAWCG